MNDRRGRHRRRPRSSPTACGPRRCPRATPSTPTSSAATARTTRSPTAWSTGWRPGSGCVVLAVGPGRRLVLAAGRGVGVRDPDGRVRAARRLANGQAEKVLHGLVAPRRRRAGLPAPGRPGQRHLRRAGLGGAGRRRCARRAGSSASGSAGDRRGDPVADAPGAGGGLAGVGAPPGGHRDQGRPRGRATPPAASSPRRCGSSPTRASWCRCGEQDGLYRTTPRYQVQVRELAADRAFDELLASAWCPSWTVRPAAPGGRQPRRRAHV